MFCCWYYFLIYKGIESQSISFVYCYQKNLGAHLFEGTMCSNQRLSSIIKIILHTNPPKAAAPMPFALIGFSFFHAKYKIIPTIGIRNAKTLNPGLFLSSSITLLEVKQPQWMHIIASSSICFPHVEQYFIWFSFLIIKKCAAEATHRKTHSSDCCYTSFLHTIFRYAEKEYAFLPKVKIAHLYRVNTIDLCSKFIVTCFFEFVNIL